MRVKIDTTLCNGCGACVRACTRKALSLCNGSLKINESLCNLCMLCQVSCKQEAISLPITQKIKRPEYNKVCVFLSPEHHNIEGINLDLLNWGIKLSLDYNAKFIIITTQPEIYNIESFGPDQIIVLEKKSLICSTLAKTLINIIRMHKPSVVLFGATILCRAIAAQIAASLKLGLSADCIDFKIDKDTNLLLQIRPALSGNVLAEVLSLNLPQLSTVRAKTATPYTPIKKNKIEITRIECALDSVGIVLKDRIRKKFNIPLEQADIVIGGGRGLGNMEGFKLLEELAHLLGASICGSRGAVDEGWIDHSYQVGQTGISIAPKLYIACGISGAMQHIVGIRNSQVIVAINNDPNAPIFKIAHYAIIEDLYKVIPELIENFKG